MASLDIKEKIPSDIIFFCYNINASTFGQKVQEYQFDPEIEPIMLEYIQVIQAAFNSVGNGQMLSPNGEIQNSDGMGLESINEGYM